RRDGADRLLVDELDVAVALEQQDILVETGDAALQAHTAGQEDRELDLLLHQMTQKLILKLLVRHGLDPWPGPLQDRAPPLPRERPPAEAEDRTRPPGGFGTPASVAPPRGLLSGHIRPGPNA